MFRGYDEANEIVHKMSELLKDNPITEENVIQWLHFTRTITTNAQIIDDETMRLRKDMK